MTYIRRINIDRESIKSKTSSIYKETSANTAEMLLFVDKDVVRINASSLKSRSMNNSKKKQIKRKRK